MLIEVMYNDDQTLLCNADCAAVNLLGHVRKQTGHMDCEFIDLADETGEWILSCDAEKLNHRSTHYTSHHFRL